MDLEAFSHLELGLSPDEPREPKPGKRERYKTRG